jgi:hypothetical protein
MNNIIVFVLDKNVYLMQRIIALIEYRSLGQVWQKYF